MSLGGPLPQHQPLPGAPHFTLDELIRSDTAQTYGLDNSPSPAALERLGELARLVLEPLRGRFGPIKVTSGYRSPELNWYVSLDRTSRHCRGEATDLRPLAPEATCPHLALWAASHLPCNQIILYNYFRSWVHLDLAQPGALSPRLYVSQGLRSPARVSAEDLARLVADGTLARNQPNETC
ncbi:MAG: hypothetical protein K9K65_05680 [Desulfarculaceae bacterium]|nr:hypothetical protein [Desulfarculaceae bacterium]MCF8047092.1 hypothetical protein [Desulfarculaceae bacterium]MCF8064606.1 hypothetical protein [Desulfarculaceae bacterium]MCF8097314.1 hypothetical protein [Desulfarculaceae bacterium]MCF8121879.1 hypothetical protein [Desulfarculaceae bacterium]